MKSSVFKLSMAALVLCAVVLSCNKEQILSSEVKDKGFEGEVSARTVTNEEGLSVQQLSYKSRLSVKGMTKGSFDRDIVVTVTNELPDVAASFNREFRVDALTLKRCYSWQYTRYVKTRVSQESPYVSIADSTLVVSVDCGYFQFDYKLLYEVPVYDDGVTRETMPYYRYENVVDKGYTIEAKDSKVIDGIAYGCSILHHSIDVTFAGQVYTINANITLLKELGPASEPYVVRAKIISTTATVIEDGIRSYITINRLWSDGTTSSSDYSVRLSGYAQQAESSDISEDARPADLKYTGLFVKEDNVYSGVKYGDYIFSTSHWVTYSLDFNCLTIDFEVLGGTAYFDDGMLMCTLISNDIEDVQYVSHSVDMTGEDFDYSSGRHYVLGWLYVTIKVQFTTSDYIYNIKQPLVFYTD